MTDPIPFHDLARVNRPLHEDYRRAFDSVTESGMYLRATQTAAFEEEWAAFCGQRFAVACNSGTDALTLAALASGMATATVQANTLPLTAVGLAKAGASVRLTDVGEDGRPRALGEDSVPVLLYGRLPGVSEEAAGLFDAAHAHGWRPPAGSLAAWSFYPTKTLGALGDAGAVTTDDESAAEAMRGLRGGDDRLHDRRQITSRMDELQAAFLRVKLRSLPQWLEERARVAARYDEALRPLGLPVPGRSLNHLYVIAVDGRDGLHRELAERGIGSKVHWPTALDELDGPWEVPVGGCPGARTWSSRVLSLPIYPYLTDSEIDRVVRCVVAFVGG